MANSTNSTTFVVKKVKPGRKEGDKSFYMEVGRLVMRDGDKGVNGTLFLHMFDGQYAVFPVEKKEENGGQE